MKYIINEKEEQLMILMVALRYQLRLNNDDENTRNKIYMVETLGKSLYNINFDSYDFAACLRDKEEEKFYYVDEEYTYKNMVDEGIVDIFRSVAERCGYDYEYTK